MDINDLRARAGITYLGKYRSSNPIWVRAMRDLGKAVTVPAVDRGVQRRLGDRAAGLNAKEDNRSVTSPQWVEEGLSRYGCPLHASGYRGESSSAVKFTVSGVGPCACRRPREPKGDSADSSSSSQKGTLGSGILGVASPASLPRVLGSADANSNSENGRGSLPGGRARDYTEDKSRRPWDSESYRDAFRATLSVAGDDSGGRRPYSLDEVVRRFIHRKSYAGAPYFVRNERVLDKGLDAARRIWSGDRSFGHFATGKRVQPGPSGPKTRLVWMASLPTTIVGSAFSKRVHQNLERKRPFAIGLRAVEKGALVSELQSRFRYVYSLDVSGFDASAPACMLDDVFRVLRTHLDIDAHEREVWERFVSDFIHSRIITPDGSVFQKHKGIPSGSSFTSLVGSVTNLLLLNYVWIRATGAALKSDRVLIQGDDSIIASNTRIDLGELARYAAELGFTLSVEKSGVSDSHREVTGPFDGTVHFLGHQWYHGWAHRSEKEILQRMVFVERHAPRTQAESLMRLYAYLSDAWEAWGIYTTVFPAEDSLHSLTMCLDEIGDEVDIEAVDLPGQLRYHAAVVQESGEDPIPVRGLGLGMTSLVY